MQRQLSNLLRLALALAGLAFIAWSLTWSDQLVLPVGTTLPDGSTLAAAERVRLIDGEPGRAGDRVVVQLPSELGAGETMSLDAERVGGGPADVQYERGVVSTLAGARWSLVVAGVLLVGTLPFLQTARWLMLLRSQGLDPGMTKAFRLTLVGQFFNFCMPGMTGGDLVKAYYAAKGSGRRGAAVMSVVFDRVAGLLSIILLAGLVGLLLLDDPMVRSLTLVVWLVMLALVVFAMGYFSQRFRRWVGIDWLQRRLGEGSVLTRIDQAALAYRSQPGAVLGAVMVSLPAHLAQMLATALAGWALGIDLSLGVLLVVLPIVYFVGSLPITYQGLGVMEGVAFALLLGLPAAGGEAGAGATVNQIVGMLLLGRLYLLVYGLLGSVYVLRGGMHLFPQDEAMADDETPSEQTLAAR
ncbi:lysylphosphatidylglycerol synthase transmembrane domain-containing protein [Phycisphaerales bacterium AB-hyl4]|uniref:Lysylphosphatidylglycerol synthase transmembrane domain-containing protein n=1 Tax=Natronomicrosphaera hydrolytica TaxID=3242702 RepID=A0ABV4U488_9BACT